MANQWESYDEKYMTLKKNVLKAILFTGLLATFVGGTYNTCFGYTGWPVAIHVVGFVLLLLSIILFRKIPHTILVSAIFAYFCFAYTPFAWITMQGIYSSMTYVIYVFFLLIPVLLDGRLNLFFTIAYSLEVALLILIDAVAPPVSPASSPYFPDAFSYIVMLCILIFVSRVYKNQFTSFLESTRRDAVSDLLTGLHNHRFLTDELNSAEQAYSAAGADYSIAIIDLDDFKKINDTYGHSIGDEVLQDLGQLFSDVFRMHTVGRYGGDEFIAIFKGVPFDECVSCCEDLIARMNVQTFSRQQVPLTLSIGLCKRSQIDSSNLFEETDKLLYAAKTKSKNNLQTS